MTLAKRFIFWYIFGMLPLLSIIACAGSSDSSKAHAPDSQNSKQAASKSPDEIIRQTVLQYPNQFHAVIYNDFPEFIEKTYVLLQQTNPSLAHVDKSHRLNEDYAPVQLVVLDTISNLHLSKSNMEGTSEAVEALAHMSAAMDALGLKLMVSSAYRTFSYQKRLYENSLLRDGFVETALSIALPGASEHQLGTTFDFGDITPSFADTRESAWLVQHAHEYGFSLSYPEESSWITGYMYEPWHYRYIGVEAAQFSRDYFKGIHYYTLHFLETVAERIPRKE